MPDDVPGMFAHAYYTSVRGDCRFGSAPRFDASSLGDDETASTNHYGSMVATRLALNDSPAGKTYRRHGAAFCRTLVPTLTTL